MSVPRFSALGTGPFATTHEAFTAVDEIDWGLAVLDVDPDVRELGRRTFQQRALDEQRSLVAFSELLTALCHSGAPVDVIGSMTRVVRDEALHVDLCDRMVRRLGGWDEAPPEPRWVSLPAEWPPKKRILATILGSLCVGETISVALFRAARGNATDPIAHEVLTRMLADESFHARFGFWWLESMPRAEHEQRFADQCVARVLRSVVTELLPTQTDEGLARQGLPRTATPYGGVAPSDREAAVIQAVETIIVPGFEKAGIEAARHWAVARGGSTT